MKKLVNGLLTTKYTEVYHEDPEQMKYNAPHDFIVVKVPTKEDIQSPSSHIASNPTLAHIHFQEGPIKECGVNGVANEDLIGMVLCRLEHFQKSEFQCRENALAITKLEEALMWLRKRTLDREARGVEGTHKV